MALVKPAHMLFTDREEPREAFWQTLRKLEEDPQGHQIITYYGEGGIGKTWLLNELKRNIDRMETEPKYRFKDGFSFRGKYVSVLYDLETSTDLVEVLCHLRYRLQLAEKDLSFPIFDVAVKKYKEITGLTLSVAEKESGSALAKYEEMLETASLFIPGLGLLSDLYERVKKGGQILSDILEKIEDKKRRETYREYYEAIAYSETAEDLKRNMVEFFKTDLNNSERDYAIVFLIDTFELLQKDLASDRWLSEELTDTNNTCWVLAGRNKIYPEKANEHLLGDLSYKDSAEYLQKEGIEDQDIIDKIYSASGGSPIYLYLSVVNYRREGRPSAQEFQNLYKEDLLARYIRGLNSEEKTVIRLMATMSHWTDRDFREVFEEVHQNFLSYSEAYHSLIATTMITKDNEERYFLHRAARDGIFDDWNYPEELRSASLSAILKVYNERAKKKEDLHYYSERIREFLEHCAKKSIKLKDSDHRLLHDILRRLARALYAYGTAEIGRLADTVERNREKLCGTVFAEACLDDMMGEMKRLCGEYEKAVVYFDKAIENYRKSCPENDRFYLVCLNERTLAYSDAGYRRKALSLMEKLYEIDKRIYGPEHHETLTVQGNLGLEYCDNGMYEKSAEILNEVIAIKRKTMKEDDPQLLANYHNLAIAYSDMGNLEKSIPLFEKVWQRRKKVSGERHPETMLTARLLASDYFKAGKKEKALPMLETIYAAQKEVLGEASPDTLSTLNQIGFIYYQSRQFEKAREIHTEAYEKALSSYGENADLTLSITNSLSLDYLALKEYEKAHDLLQKVYDFRSQVQDQHDPNLLMNLSNLVRVEINMGDLASAEKKALDCYERLQVVFGKKHDRVITILEYLKEIYHSRKDYEKELEVEKELGHILIEKKGEDDAETLHVMNDLATCCYNLKDFSRAIVLYERVASKHKELFGENNANYKIVQKSLKLAYKNAVNTENDPVKKKKLIDKEEQFFGNTDRDVLNTKLIYALSLSKNGDEQSALELNKDIFSKCTETYGENDPLTLQALNNLAYQYGRVNELETHLKLSREAYEKRRAVLGAEHPDTILSLSNLAYAYKKNGAYEEAIAIHREVLSIRRRLFGNDDRRTALAVYSLAEILYTTGDYDEALGLYEELLKDYQKLYGEDNGNTRFARRRLQEVREILQKNSIATA